jgi:selenium metabolism protein YedF
MMKEIDARGLTCPAPVLQTRAILIEESPAALRVLVDNAAAQQNVQRFLESQGYHTSLEQSGADYLVTGSAGERLEGEPAPAAKKTPAADKKIIVLCATDRMGFGDDALGLSLMVNFLSTLKEMGGELWRCIFVNSGVKLTIEGARTLEALTDLEGRGVKILVCGTCLNHYRLLEKKRVGETTNMLDIVTALQLADKVISL